MDDDLNEIAKMQVGNIIGLMTTVNNLSDNQVRENRLQLSMQIYKSTDRLINFYKKEGLTTPETIAIFLEKLPVVLNFIVNDDLDVKAPKELVKTKARLVVDVSEFCSIVYKHAEKQAVSAELKMKYLLALVDIYNLRFRKDLQHQVSDQFLVNAINHCHDLENLTLIEGGQQENVHGRIKQLEESAKYAASSLLVKALETTQVVMGKRLLTGEITLCLQRIDSLLMTISQLTEASLLVCFLNILQKKIVKGLFASIDYQLSRDNDLTTFHEKISAWRSSLVSMHTVAVTVRNHPITAELDTFINSVRGVIKNNYEARFAGMELDSLPNQAIAFHGNIDNTISELFIERQNIAASNQEWQDERAELKTRLAEVNDSHSITEAYRGFVQWLFARCCKVLGEPLCKYVILAHGSMARAEMNKESDFEFFVIIDKEPASLIIPHLNLLNYKVQLLNQAFQIDLQNSPYNDEANRRLFCSTIDNFASNLVDNKKFPVSNINVSLIRSTFVSGDAEFWNAEVLPAMQAKLQEVEPNGLTYSQQVALESCCSLGSDGADGMLAEFESDILLKKNPDFKTKFSYLQRFLFNYALLHDLAFFTQDKLHLLTHHDELLNVLKASGKITENLAERWQEAISLVYSIKCNPSDLEKNHIQLQLIEEELYPALYAELLGAIDQILTQANHRELCVPEQLMNATLSQMTLALRKFVFDLTKSEADFELRLMRYKQLYQTFPNSKDCSAIFSNYITLFEAADDANKIIEVLRSYPTLTGWRLSSAIRQEKFKAKLKALVVDPNLISVKADNNSIKAEFSRIRKECPSLAARIKKYQKVYQALPEFKRSCDSVFTVINQIESSDDAVNIIDILQNKTFPQILVTMAPLNQESGNSPKHYYLDPRVVSQLYTLENGMMMLRDKPKYISSQHHTLSVVINNRVYWFKFWPFQPGSEKMVQSLVDRAVDGGTQHCSLLYLEVQNKYLTCATVLVSEQVPGELLTEAQRKQKGPMDNIGEYTLSLSDVFKYDPMRLQAIHPRSFTQTLMRILLTNPEDDKDNDYFLVPVHKGKKRVYEIVRIDNEHAFFNPFKDKKNQSLFGSPYLTRELQMKSIIFCLNQMQDSHALDWDLLKEFAEIDSVTMLADWLKELTLYQEMTSEQLQHEIDKASSNNVIKRSRINQTKKPHSPETILSSEILAQTDPGCVFKPGLLVELYERLYYLKATILEYLTGSEVKKNAVNPEDLLLGLYQELKGIYQNSFAQYPMDPNHPEVANRRFSYLTAQLYQLNTKGHRQTRVTRPQARSECWGKEVVTIEESIQCLLGGRMSPQASLRKGGEFDSIEKDYLANLEKLLFDVEPLTRQKTLENFKKLHPILQRKISHSIQVLVSNGKYAGEIRQSLFEVIKCAPPHKLRLNGFSDLVTHQALLEILQKAGLYLELLDLTGCTLLTSESINKIALLCKKLKDLTIAGLVIKDIGIARIFTSQRDPILFEVLNKLTIKDCLHLLSFNIAAPALAFFILENCVELELTGVKLNAPEDIVIKSSGCRKLYKQGITSNIQPYLPIQKIIYAKNHITNCKPAADGKYRIKVVHVGDSRHGGKSTLFFLYATGIFSNNVKPTIGVDVTCFQREITDYAGVSHKSYITCWDIAGGKTFRNRSRVRVYYKSAHVAVIFYSNSPYRNTFYSTGSYPNRSKRELRVKDWAKQIEMYAPQNIPTILVHSKVDLHSSSERQHYYLNGLEIAKEIKAIAYRECSAKTGEGTEGLLDTIAKVGLGLPVEFALPPAFAQSQSVSSAGFFAQQQNLVEVEASSTPGSKQQLSRKVLYVIR